MLEKQNLKEKIIKLYNMSLILDMAGMAFFILCILFQEKLYMFATEELMFTVPWPEVVSNAALLASHGVFVLIIKKQLKRGKKDIVVEITGLNWIFLLFMMSSLYFMFVDPYLYGSADFSEMMSIIAMQTYYNVFTTVMHISQALFFVACGLSISYKAIEQMQAIKTVYLVALALGFMDWSMSMYLVINQNKTKPLYMSLEEYTWVFPGDVVILKSLGFILQIFLVIFILRQMRRNTYKPFLEKMGVFFYCGVLSPVRYLVTSLANILVGAQGGMILAELMHVRSMVGRYGAAGKMSAALMLIGFGLSMGYGKMRTCEETSDNRHHHS